MAKYIIEFEDDPYMREDGVNYYTCKSARWYKLGETVINRLAPYTEPDRKAIEDEVWELADYMCRMDVQERDLCFGFQSTTEVTVNLSYQEAKSKFEAWLKQKDEIRVGDEVVDAETDKGIVTYIRGYLCDVLWDDGGVTEEVEREELYKTGRHFPEIAELLKKMRDSDD